MPSNFDYASSLVYTLERRNRLALVLVQCRGNHFTVAQINLAMRLLLEGEGVLHPFLIITLGEVLTGVSTSGFLSVGGSGGGLSTKSSIVSIC